MLVSTLFTVLAAGIATAVPLNRRDVALDAAATAEAQKFDATATRAFTATTITTSDGKCLSVDPFSGDFRENLTPVNVVACDGSKNQTWDVITAGVHNNVKGQALIVSSLTNACLNFDSRRAAGNQVLLFSCGGRADGSGQVTDSQLFAFNGTAGPQALIPQVGKNAVCLTVNGNLIDQTACNGAATELFTFGGQAASAPVSASASPSAIVAAESEDCGLPLTVTKTVTIDSAATGSASSGTSTGGNAGTSTGGNAGTSTGGNTGTSGNSGANKGSSSTSKGSSGNNGNVGTSTGGKSGNSGANAGGNGGNSGSNTKASGGNSATNTKASGGNGATNTKVSTGNGATNTKASGGEGSSTSTSVAAASSATVLAVTPPPATAEDPQALQSSLTISPSVIQNTDDGQNPPVTGQSPADVSTNNFANLCATTLPQVPLTNGLQITTGSCNPIPIGYIPAVDKIPSSKYQFPINGGTIASDTTFNVVLKTVNMQIGVFTNAQKTYFGNPQKLNAQGQIIGHTHVVIESIPSIDTTEVTNAQNFVFFKGVNDPNDGNDEVTVPVAGGLKPGAYRMCTILSSQTHQPVITAVAQHGSVDDCVYFSTTPGGVAAGTGAAAGAGAAAPAAVASTSAAPAVASSVAAPAVASSVADSAVASSVAAPAVASSVAAPAASAVAAPGKGKSGAAPAKGQSGAAPAKGQSGAAPVKGQSAAAPAESAAPAEAAASPSVESSAAPAAVASSVAPSSTEAAAAATAKAASESAAAAAPVKGAGGEGQKKGGK